MSQQPAAHPIFNDSTRPNEIIVADQSDTECSRVNLRSIRNGVRSGSSIGAVSRLASTAETLVSSCYARAATPACVFVHTSHSLVFDTQAPNSSRSPTDHVEGPRIASWMTTPIGMP
jgi:hypothetical protein